MRKETLIPVLALSMLPQGWAVVHAARLGYAAMTRTVTLNRRARMLSDLATEREPAAEIRACQAEPFVGAEYRRVANMLREHEIAVGLGQARVKAVGRGLAALAIGATIALLVLLLQVGWVPLSGVGFRYHGSDRTALTGIDLTIHRGQVVALVGENGSGKTTLAKLITGLYRPSEGQIRWDGVELAELDPVSAGDRVGMVTQSPVRWPHDARTNVRLGRHDRPDPDDVALRAAAAAAGAGAVIDELPGGWQSLLSGYFRGGTELSGGQWQRLAVARGLFRDARPLVLDEPTAPMDAKAEFAVYESLRRLSAGRTVVLITHRLASVHNADRIYLLHQGKLAEQGTHAELLALGGRYAELYRLQADMYAAAEVNGAGRP